MRKQSPAKKLISLIVGIPAFIIAVSEPATVEYSWIPLLAMAVLIGVMAWNGIFEQPDERSYRW